MIKLSPDPTFIRMVRSTIVAWAVTILFAYLVYSVAMEIGREAGIF